MYIPEHFKETRQKEIDNVIEQHPLGTLIYITPEGLDATHLPFIYNRNLGERGTLFGHVARKNPIWREVNNGDEVLTIFHANDAYISPNWYPSRHEHHQQVPTWDYQVVHVHGKIYVRDDKKFVRGFVAKLSQIHETRAGESKPWKMSDSTKDYIDQKLAEIVGIEIQISRITAASKLSQNKETRDKLNVISELRKRHQDAMADAIMLASPLTSAGGKRVP
jgi:transcriptional regulator